MFSDPEIWLCATCGEQTAADPCTVCGQPAALQDRYRLMRRLGTGESSTTWLAWDAHEAQTVAIKELPWRAGDLQARARMVREAEVLQQLSHPGVPTYIDHFWTRQGRHHAMCLIEEHVPGPTLLEEAKTRRYSRAEVLDIMEELLGTLVYLHERSPAVLHRDLKPANVIRRDGDGRLVLIDFSSVQDATTEPVLGPATVAGTFGFMAPEQLSGEARPQSDLYSLGALGLALLIRVAPHTLLDHHHRLRWQERLPLPPKTHDLFERLLAADPGERFSSARQARSVLRAARIADDEATQPAPLVVRRPEARPESSLSLDELEAMMRRVVRQELEQQAGRLADAREDQPPRPQRPAVIAVSAEPDRVDPMLPVLADADERALSYPANLGVFEPQPRRGWWSSRKMLPAEREQPTHPATQLVVMAGFFATLTVLIQLMISALV